MSYVTCDGAFTDCDVTQQATGATKNRDATTCLTCQASAAARLATWKMPYRWIGRWINREDEIEARNWILSLQATELSSATYNRWKIGEWVKSSVHTHFRANTLDLSDSKIASTYGSYLYSGLLASLALSRIMDEEKPDAQLLFNGRMSSTRIALELAKERGIRTLCEERCPVVGRVRLFDNANCLSVDDTDALWKTWKDTPLSLDEIEELAAFLQSRWHGNLKDVAVFSRKLQPAADVKAQLNLSVNKPIWVLFTSSVDETIDKPRSEGVFPKHHDWVEATVEHARRNPQVQLLIRVHPNAGGRRALGRNTQDEQYFTELAARAPENVQVIEGDNPISSYTLATIADLGLIWYSTIGLEMAAMGKRVVRAGQSWLAHAEFMHSASSADTYGELLDQFLNPTSDACDLDRLTSAWRFAYVWFYRQSIPFPLVDQPEWYVGDPIYESVDELKPGRDEGLDRICDVFMNNTALFGSTDAPSSRHKDIETGEISKRTAQLIEC